MKTNNKKR